MLIRKVKCEQTKKNVNQQTGSIWLKKIVFLSIKIKFENFINLNCFWISMTIKKPQNIMSTIHVTKIVFT